MSKSYGRREVLRELTLTVMPGEVYGLVGPNGAGKTTTLRIAVGLIKPSSGVVRVYGLEPSSMKAKGMIGYLPEDAGCYERLTGEEVLRFYAKLYAATLGVSVNELVSYASRISGLGERLKDKVGGYSKGMKRRLNLAVALMHKPKLAVLDEPTSGLDVHASLAVRRMIRRYAEEEGAAVIISSHNMLEVEETCDRVGFLYRGRLVAEGTPEELREKYGARNLEEAFVKATEA